MSKGHHLHTPRFRESTCPNRELYLNYHSRPGVSVKEIRCASEKMGRIIPLFGKPLPCPIPGLVDLTSI